jgi:hypothetical protein
MSTESLRRLVAWLGIIIHDLKSVGKLIEGNTTFGDTTSSIAEANSLLLEDTPQEYAFIHSFIPSFLADMHSASSKPSLPT